VIRPSRPATLKCDLDRHHWAAFDDHLGQQLPPHVNRTALKTAGFSGGNGRYRSGEWGIGNGGATGIFDGDERLKALSAAGNPLERLAQVIDFELFRSDLEAALSRSDRSKSRPLA
jgi:hypothetical protein